MACASWSGRAKATRISGAFVFLSEMASLSSLYFNALCPVAPPRLPLLSGWPATFAPKAKIALGMAGPPDLAGKYSRG
jgi:hypothetical protein